MSMEPLPRPAPRPRDESPLRHEGRPIRAVATDIDGTLTDMRRLLEWDAVLALRSVEAIGVPVILATGNVIPCTKTFQHSIGTTGPIVCENGGTLFWELNRGDGQPTERFTEILHARDEADEVVDALKAAGHHPRYISSDPWRESEAALEVDSIDPDVVRAMLKELGKEHLYVVSTGFACHILRKELNKLVGLRRALAWLNEHDPRFHDEPLTLDETLALGDSMNDYEMFKGCGAAVALPHAPAPLCEVADFVTERPHGAGVREALTRFGARIV